MTRFGRRALLRRDPAEAAEQEMARLLSGAGTLSPLDPERFVVGGKPYPPERISEALRPYLTPARRERIEEVLANRTYTVLPVLDGIANTGNVSAVMRTAEALGYQGFHVVSGEAPAKYSERTALGAEKWLDVRRWALPQACAAALRAEGYRIVVTHLEDAQPLEAFDFTQRTAVVFGNEERGVAPEWLRLADARCVIPMPGFAQSLNVSVAAGVLLHHAYRDRLARQGFHGDLTAPEREGLRALFYLRSTAGARTILGRVLSDE